MNVNERMSNVKAELARRGVRDVKFCFGLDARALPSSEVKESACHLLEQFLAGNYSKMEPLGDASIAL